MNDLKDLYTIHHQEHVFRHFSSLKEEEKFEFLNQLSSIPVHQLNLFLQAARQEQSLIQHEGDLHIGPFRGLIGSAFLDETLVSTMETIGFQAIEMNQVAVVLLAGGQGTRLGFDGPKGMYKIGPHEGTSLFQLISERLIKIIQLAKRRRTVSSNAMREISIPFYIMTSPMNHETTRSFFESNHYFGLPSRDVFFFQQGVLPCLSIEDGKILMEGPGKAAMSPDGNGGIYIAMKRCGILEDMKQRGVQYIHAFSVDNCLVKPADPVFLGYCINQKADCGNKVLWKSHSHEKVGVMAEKQGRPCIVEYSELNKTMTEMTDPITGKLVFGAANICNHFYTLDFIENLVLPNMKNMYHMALKKIPVWDENLQKVVAPEINNGIKLESFIFDVFPLSTKMAVMEVLREEEFAPVKNAPGSDSDSPEIARQMMSSRAKVWLKRAGAKLVGDVESDLCVISPLTSYSGEHLECFREVECPFSL